MNGLIIKSVEGRITLGIVMFVAIMILIGWVAINEPARMASFTEQQNGRAIERGAELFAANCSSCHGVNGLGTGQGPALNSPHFFGYDFMADVNAEIARNQREAEDLANVVTELERRKEEALTAFNALSSEAQAADEGRALLVEVADIDARLLDDAAAVESRLAAIAAGSPDALDANPELTEAELASRQTALESNIPNRLRLIDIALNGDGTNTGLLAQREAIIAELGTARLKGYLPRLEAFNAALELWATDPENAAALSPSEYTVALSEDANRTSQVGWTGTLDGFILTTLIHGRPGSNIVWGSAGMVSWSQRGGGPLRDDEIRDIMAYIMNWNKGANWTMADLNAVNQFAKLHTLYTGASGGAEGGGEGEALGPTECAANPDCVAGLGTVQEIAASLPVGDAANGANLYSANGCIGCHLAGAAAPDTTGTYARVEADRLTLEQFAGWTADEYIIASILYPNHYVVDTYIAGVMPQTFGQLLTAQQLADIVAYIKAQ